MGFWFWKDWLETDATSCFQKRRSIQTSLTYFFRIPMITTWQSFMNLLTSSCNSTSFLLNSMLRSAANPIVINFNGRKFSFSVKSKFWSWLPLTMLLKTSGLIIKSIKLLAIENKEKWRHLSDTSLRYSARN